MNDPTPAQIKMFGKPKCCEDEEMIKIPSKNLHAVIKALAQLKVNLEKELVEGFNCAQYLEVDK
jgi:chemotaxis receptor (MCP) glutamine deamidase CheD